MMYQMIKDLHQKARLQRTPLASLWSTILGDLQKAEKNGITIDDAKVIATLKSFLESATQMASYGNAAAQNEVEHLTAFIPKQMDATELESIISQSGASNMGAAMKFLKENYAGKYDGKLAQTIAKHVFR